MWFHRNFALLASQQRSISKIPLLSFSTIQPTSQSTEMIELFKMNSCARKSAPVENKSKSNGVNGIQPTTLYYDRIYPELKMLFRVFFRFVNQE